MATTGPGVLDALSLLAEVADELGVRTARDTHHACVDRVHGVLERPPGRLGPLTPTSRVAGLLHRTIAGAVYGGIGAGLRAAGRGCDVAATVGLDDRPGWRLDDHRQGRFARSAVNGLIGDRLLRERPGWALPMSVRRDGHDVAPDRAGLAAAYPRAGARVVVLLHGLCEDESCWGLRRAERGTTYPESLERAGWTPVLLRTNTGLPLRENGAALASLLGRLVAEWPVPVERMALVGHSMGGLVFRAATAVVTAESEPTGPPAGRWTDLVSDVVTLGTPHHGASLAVGANHGDRLLSLARETAAFGRILDHRSAGIRDLVHGLSADVPPLPHARYRLVAATVTGSAGHPVGRHLGDLLVTPDSAVGRDRAGRELFPGASTLHVGRTDHFGLLNHERVLEALHAWLAE